MTASSAVPRKADFHDARRVCLHAGSHSLPEAKPSGERLVMRQRRSGPVIDQFEIAKLRGLAGRINALNNRLAPRMSVVEVHVQMRSGTPIRADIDKVVKGGVTVAGASGKSKDLVVVGAASLVPEIFSRGELQPVQIAAELPLLRRTVNDLYEIVCQVHQIVDGGSCINARSREQFDKSAVHVIVRIVVTSAPPPSTAYPRSAGNVKELVAAFESRSARALLLHSPPAILQGSPADKVELS